MAKKIDFNAILLARSQGKKQANEIIDAIIGECANDDPPYLSDVLAHKKGGPLVQVRLGEEAEKRGGKNFRWKIRVLCDDYGQVPQPGDVVTRTIRERSQLYSDQESHTLWGNADMDVAKMQGTYADDFETRIEFVIDDKGCIECGFDDAVAFLNGHGVHGVSGRPLNPHNAKRVTDEPVKLKSGPHAGEFKHIHYWRYQEVDAEQYEALPKLTKKRSRKTGTDDELSA